MDEHEEVEKHNEEHEERCTHSFHGDDAPKDDDLALVLSVIGEGIFSTGMRLGEEEGEDRAELLKQQQRFEAERCPRCGRPHHEASVES